MTAQKISGLPPADPLTGAELVEVVQAGVNKSASSQDVGDLSPSGENNTASNVGSGADIFKQKVGVDLQFRGILGIGDVTAAVNGDNIEVSVASSPGGAQSVADLAALQALAPAGNNYANMAGRVSAGDAGEGTFRWDGTDLSATLIVSTGTTTSVNDGTDTVTDADHGLETGHAVASKTAVNGLSLDTAYYVIRVDDDDFQLASTLADAKAGTPFDLTGTTNFTWERILDPEQGVYVIRTGDNLVGADGAWVRVYEALKCGYFGAVGGGTGAVNTQALQGSFFYQGETKEELFLGAGEYDINATLNVWASDFHFTSTGDSVIVQTGPQQVMKVGDRDRGWITTEANDLASNASAGDETITLAAGKGANFTAETWVVLINDATSEGGASVTNSTAEFIFIESIATDVLTLSGPLKFDATTANNAEVNRVNWIDGLHINGFDVQGAAWDTVSNVNSYNIWHLSWCYNPRLADIGGTGTVNWNIGLQGCLNGNLQRIRGEDQESNGITTTPGFGYTIVELDLNQGLVVDDIQVTRTRHGYTTATLGLLYGVPIGSVISNGVATEMRGAGWDTHPEGLDISFVGCTTIGSVSHGFQDRAIRTNWTNITARDCIGAGMNISADATLTQVNGFSFHRTNLGSFNGTDWRTKGKIEDLGASTITDNMILKRADQTVNNSTTLVDDDDLTLPLEADDRFHFMAIIRYSTNSTADIKIAFTGPGGSAIRHGPSGGGAFDATETWVSISEGGGGAAKQYGGFGSTRILTLSGYCENGTTAGDFRLQFAQATADASNTFLQRNSYMMIWRR